MKKIFKNIFEKVVKRIHTQIKYIEKQNIIDRKEKILISLQSVGENVFLNGSDWTFTGQKKIIIGNNVHIGNNAFFAGHGGLIIGDNTHISRNVTIYTTNHDYNGKALPYDSRPIYKPVTIKENVWIGMNVSIVPGVTIGKGAIIGLGTVVNRNVEDYEIVGSAKTINLKFRDQKHYVDLLTNNQFGGRNGKLLSKSILQNFKRSYFENKTKNIVFILSTGRAGSHSIIETLNQHPEIMGFHEDIQQLIRLSTEYASSIKRKVDVLDEFQAILETKIWQANENQLLIHSDQRLWNFVDFLNSYFPNAKFIHLIRDPESCIKSMVARNWFQNDEFELYNQQDWALFRLNGSETADVLQNDWNEMSVIDRAAWYWFYINTQIISQLSQLDNKKTFSVQTENLNTQLDKILRFLEVSEINIENKLSNVVKKKHVQNYNTIREQDIKKAILKVSKMTPQFEALLGHYLQK